MSWRWYQRITCVGCMLALLLLVATDFLLSRHPARTTVDVPSTMDTRLPSPPRQQLNPGHAICGHSSVLLLIYVHSAPAYWHRRYLIRHTWGSHEFMSRYLHMEKRLLFVMGTVADASVQAAVERESRVYGDMLQGDFVDTYRNLTRKAVTALRWATRYCPQAKFVLKTDDDILVHIAAVVDYIAHLEDTKQTFWCNVWDELPVLREPDSRWFVPVHEYPHDVYPRYCSGSAILMSGDLIRLLYNASHSTPFFWIDDVYVTGMVALTVNVTFVDITDKYVLIVSQSNVDAILSGNASFFFLHQLSTSDWYITWHHVATGSVQQALEGRRQERRDHGTALSTQDDVIAAT